MFMSIQADVSLKSRWMPNFFSAALTWAVVDSPVRLESMGAITPRTSPTNPDAKLLESMPLLLGDTSRSERSVKVSPHYAPSLYLLN